MRRLPTLPAPPQTTTQERLSYRAQVQRTRERRLIWRTTGDFNVPGWVLGEMWVEGIIDHRKRSGSSPNEWR